MFLKFALVLFLSDIFYFIFHSLIPTVRTIFGKAQYFLIYFIFNDNCYFYVWWCPTLLSCCYILDFIFFIYSPVLLLLIFHSITYNSFLLIDIYVFFIYCDLHFNKFSCERFHCGLCAINKGASCTLFCLNKYNVKS